MQVRNRKDPSGMGMYSKTGLFTNELYSVFRKKEEILNKKRKFMKVDLFPTLEVSIHFRYPFLTIY